MTLRLNPPNKEARLPSVACEEDFAAEVKNFAKANGGSLAALIRTSLRFFLDANVENSESKPGNKKQSKRTKKTEKVMS